MTPHINKVCCQGIGISHLSKLSFSGKLVLKGEKCQTHCNITAQCILSKHSCRLGVVCNFYLDAALFYDIYNTWSIFFIFLFCVLFPNIPSECRHLYKFELAEV